MGYEVVLSVFSCSLHQDNEASVWLIAIFDINLTKLHQLLNPLSRWPLLLNLINTQQYSVLPLQCPTTLMMNNVKLRLICQMKHKIIQYSTLSKSNQNSNLITMFFCFFPTFYIITLFPERRGFPCWLHIFWWPMMPKQARKVIFFPKVPARESLAIGGNSVFKLLLFLFPWTECQHSEYVTWVWLSPKSICEGGNFVIFSAWGNNCGVWHCWELPKNDTNR